MAPSTANTTTRCCGRVATMRAMVCRGLSHNVTKGEAAMRAGVCVMRSEIALVNQCNLARQRHRRKRQSKRPPGSGPSTPSEPQRSLDPRHHRKLADALVVIGAQEGVIVAE